MRTGASERIEIQQHLNQVIVDRFRTRLYEKYVLVAYHFVHHDMGLAVRHAPGCGLAELYMEDLCDLLGQFRMGGPCKYAQGMI
jgi:hypothetical protein